MFYIKRWFQWLLQFFVVLQSLKNIHSIFGLRFKFTEPVAERGRTLSRIQIAKAGANFRGRKSNSLMNLCGKATRKMFKKITLAILA